jgi:hypothetical protein
MNLLKIILFPLVITFCSVTKQSNKISASEQVLNKIEYIENQFNKYKKDKKADFIKEINEIVNLSEIVPEEKHFTGSDYIIYIPTQKNIDSWKEWHTNNIDNFYYSPDDRLLIDLKISESVRNEIIFIKTTKGIIRNSLSSNLKSFLDN